MKIGGVYIFPGTRTRLRNVPFSESPGLYDNFDDMAADYRAEIWATISDYERGRASMNTLDNLLTRAL